MTTISVVTIVSKAVELKYPIEVVLESVAPIADEVVVNIDTSSEDDGTWQLVFKKLSLLLAMKQAQGLPLDARLHWGRIVASPWNWNSRDAGQELARQTNIAFEACTGDWILYLQADEVLHEVDHDYIRWLTTLPEDYVGVEFVRLYFWRDLKTLRTDWTFPLVRMFRRGQGRSVGDAMNCAVDGLVWPPDEGLPRLYHYTRLGTAEEIGARLRNLDSLFHAPEELDDAKPYDFALRNVDSHLKAEYRTPQAISKSVLVPYGETHPKVMLTWLREGGRR